MPDQVPQIPPIEARSAASWRAALVFLTRLPIDGRGTTLAMLAQAVWAFPLVGVLVGVIGGLVQAGALAWHLPPLAAALLGLTAATLTTGALHEDGLSDVADGFGAGGAKARIMEIMRDSRIGAFGALALVFSVGLRASALAAFGDPRMAVLAWVAAGAGSRALMPPVMRLMNPARADGLGADIGRPSIERTALAVALGAGVVLAALGPLTGNIALIAATLGAAGFALFARARIGGYTGDVLGAVQQTGEIMILLAAASAVAGGG